LGIKPPYRYKSGGESNLFLQPLPFEPFERSGNSALLSTFPVELHRFGKELIAVAGQRVAL
jgi:hypothetical protein